MGMTALYLQWHCNRSINYGTGIRVRRFYYTITRWQQSEESLLRAGAGRRVNYTLPKAISVRRVVVGMPALFGGNDHKFFKLDKLSEADYELIYRLKSVRFYIILRASLMTLMLLLPTALGCVYLDRFGIIAPWSANVDEVMAPAVLYLSDKEALTAFVCAMVINLSLCKLIFAFPLRIYHNECRRKYVAILLQFWRPWATKKYEFTVGRKSGLKFALFPNTLHKLDGKTFRLYPDNFKRPIDYNKLFGDFVVA